MTQPRRRFLDRLEDRRLMAVTPMIQLLGGQNTLRAGQALHVSAVAAPFVAGTDLDGGTPITSRYQWDFGDTTEGAKYNALPGFNAAHVYATAGTYNVTLRVTNASGNVGSTTTTISVLPYTPTRAIYVDLDTSSTLPDGGLRATSFSQINSLLTDNSVVYFKRGQTITVDTALSVSKQNVTITDFGDPDASVPLLQLSSSAGTYSNTISMTSAARNVVIRNLSFTTAGSNKLGETIAPAGQNILIQNCKLDNAQTAIQAANQPAGLLVQDNVSGTTAAYFCFVKGTDEVFLGNTIGDSLNQHNIRTYAQRVLCYANDLTNIPNNSSLHSLRVNEGNYIYWANNVIHGGFAYIGPLAPESAGSLPGAEVHNVVVENNQFLQIPRVFNNNNRINVVSGSYDVMIRNNYIEATDTTAINAETYKRMTWTPELLPAGNSTASNAITVTKLIKGLFVLNNTVVNPDLGNGTNTGTKGSFLTVSGSTVGAVTAKNNLYVAPRLDTTSFTSAALRVTDRSDLQNFTTLSSGGGLSGNVWPLLFNANSFGVNYVPGSNTSGSYRTPSEWASDFPAYVTLDNFELLQPSSLDNNYAPPTRSLAATAAIPIYGVFTDRLGRDRTGTAWTAGAVTITQIIVGPPDGTLPDPSNARPTSRLIIDRSLRTSLGASRIVADVLS